MKLIVVQQGFMAIQAINHRSWCWAKTGEESSVSLERGGRVGGVVAFLQEGLSVVGIEGIAVSCTSWRSTSVGIWIVGMAEVYRGFHMHNMTPCRSSSILWVLGESLLWRPCYPFSEVYHRTVLLNKPCCAPGSNICPSDSLGSKGHMMLKGWTSESSEYMLSCFLFICRVGCDNKGGRWDVAMFSDLVHCTWPLAKESEVPFGLSARPVPIPEHKVDWDVRPVRSLSKISSSALKGMLKDEFIDQALCQIFHLHHWAPLWRKVQWLVWAYCFMHWNCWCWCCHCYCHWMRSGLVLCFQYPKVDP